MDLTYFNALMNRIGHNTASVTVNLDDDPDSVGFLNGVYRNGEFFVYASNGSGEMAHVGDGAPTM
jgi:hypothetical protein